MVERYCDSQNIAAYSNQGALYDYFENKEEKQKAQNKLKGKYAQFFKQKKYVRDYLLLDDEKCDTFNKLQKRYCDPYGRILYSRACISIHAGAMRDYALLGRFNPNGEKFIQVLRIMGFFAFDISNYVFL